MRVFSISCLLRQAQLAFQLPQGLFADAADADQILPVPESPVPFPLVEDGGGQLGADALDGAEFLRVGMVGADPAHSRRTGHYAPSGGCLICGVDYTSISSIKSGIRAR